MAKRKHGKKGKTHCVMTGKTELACYKTKAKAKAAAKRRRKAGKKAHVKTRAKR